MGKSAIGMGIAIIIFGVWLTFKVLSPEIPLWVLIYPLVTIGIGIGLIIFNKEEDKIEKRKDLKERKTK